MTQRSARFAAGTLHLGDCLSVLGALRRRRAPRFDLAYLDPPFATGKDHGARVRTGQRVRGALAYGDAWGGVEGLLTMLEPRLSLVGELLSAQGSLWIHLDHRAVHDAKLLADRLFGRSAFRGEIVWLPGNGARRQEGPSVTHQTILIYAPHGRMLWNADEKLLREPYAELSQRMHFTHTDGAGRRFRERRIAGKTYRYYADRGRRLGSVWSDCPAMRANTPLVAEATGYPTQKPERLLERIVAAASVKRSWVLDPMCGSGTTLAVASELGRRFVGVDASPLAFDLARARLNGSRPRARPRAR